MAKYIGRLADIGVGVESVRGTAVSASVTIPKTNYNFNDRANKAVSVESLGLIAGQGADAIVTQRFGEGSIDGEVNANSIPALLYSLFGTLTSAGENGAYKHTLALDNTNTHKSLTVHISENGTDRAFRNAVVDTFELTVNTGEFVTFTAGLKSKKGNENTFTPSYTVTDYKFAGRDAIIKTASNVAGLAGATKICVKELKLTFSANADYTFCLGTLEPSDIHNKQFTIEGTLTIDQQDGTYRDLMTNGTYQAISLYIENARQTIGSNTPKLYFELPRVEFSEWESPKDSDDIVAQTIKFTALVNQADSKLISDCYVVNNIASY